MRRSRYSDTTITAIALLCLLVGLITLLNMGLLIASFAKESERRSAFGQAFTTWYIPDTFDCVIMTPGDRVPFQIEEASAGITMTRNYSFILPNSGVYTCTTQAVSKFNSCFFDLVLNPDSTSPVTLPGSEFNSDSQWNEEGLNPVTVMFNAAEGDQLTLIYADSNPTGETVILGRLAEPGPNRKKQPIAYIHIVQIA